MDLHSKLSNFFARAVDLVILNVLFVVTSLPIVTLGASITALYAVTLRMVRGEESSIAKAYFHAFRQNFLPATGGFLLLGIPSVLMGINLFLSYGREEAGMMVLFSMSLFFLCVFGILLIYFFPVLARFQFTIRQVLMHIPHMIFTHFIAFLLIMASMAALAVIVLFSTRAALIWLEVSFVIGWAFMAYVKSFFFRLVFEDYECSEPDTAGDLNAKQLS